VWRACGWARRGWFRVGLKFVMNGGLMALQSDLVQGGPQICNDWVANLWGLERGPRAALARTHPSISFY
jgi:hypothetical protein